MDSKTLKGMNLGNLAATLALFLAFLLVGCSEDRVQSCLNTPSLDNKHVAIVRDVFAENTTGTIPQLFVLPTGQRWTSDSGHVADGSLNGGFAVSWTSSDSLLVSYTAGEWPPNLPATTNFHGITITFRPSH
jgi:hypothetical protein